MKGRRPAFTRTNERVANKRERLVASHDGGRARSFIAIAYLAGLQVCFSFELYLSLCPTSRAANTFCQEDRSSTCRAADTQRT